MLREKWLTGARARAHTHTRRERDRERVPVFILLCSRSLISSIAYLVTLSQVIRAARIPPDQTELAFHASRVVWAVYACTRAMDSCCNCGPCTRCQGEPTSLVCQCYGRQRAVLCCQPVWPSGKALGWQAGPRLDSASAVRSLQTGCDFVTLSLTINETLK